MTRVFARLTFVVLLTVPAVATARQTFKSQQPQPAADFKTETAPQLSITMEPGDLPVKVRHVSGLSTDTIDARARTVKITYTKTGLTVDLSDGNWSSTKGTWRASPQLFQTLQLEVGTNGELIWAKMK